MFRTTSEDAVYLPVGYLHTVFTVVGGLISTVDFVTIDSLKTFVTMISGGLDQIDDHMSFQGDCFDHFSASIEIALAGNQVDRAISSWLEMLEYAREYAVSDKVWLRQVNKIWDLFFATPAAKKIVCPCGYAGSFPEHFRAEHMCGKKSGISTRGLGKMRSKVKAVKMEGKGARKRKTGVEGGGARKKQKR